MVDKTWAIQKFFWRSVWSRFNFEKKQVWTFLMIFIFLFLVTDIFLDWDYPDIDWQLKIDCIQTNEYDT